MLGVSPEADTGTEGAHVAPPSELVAERTRDGVDRDFQTAVSFMASDDPARRGQSPIAPSGTGVCQTASPPVLVLACSSPDPSAHMVVVRRPSVEMTEAGSFDPAFNEAGGLHWTCSVVAAKTAEAVPSTRAMADALAITREIPMINPSH